MLKKHLRALSIDRNAVLLIILGSITWSLTMVKSGLVYPFGMGFWGPNGHDGVWHISLANSLAKGSWDIPVFAGESLRNYHVGFDLILAVVHKLTLIPIHTLYFQILPPIMALSVGFFVYKFVFAWKKSERCAFWATFFIYFGGSWGWVVTFFREGKLGGESLFWSQQSISTLINPPFTLSLIFIFSGLWLLQKALKTDEKRFFILATFLFGLLVQIKVYAGILVLASLLSAGVWRMVKRRGKDLLKVFFGAAVISVLIFSPVSKNVGATLIYQPFWFLDSMMATTDRFYWPKFAEALANYSLAGNWIKGGLAYLTAFGIFWFGNLGTRILKEPSFFRHVRNFKKLSYIEVFLYASIALGVFLPMFFIQAGTAWNTIQFFYYSLAFSGVLAGIFLGELVEKYKTTRKSLVFATIALTILLTIPTTFSTLWFHYLPVRPPAKISKDELAALRFLSQQPDGVVLTLPFSKERADKAIDTPPRPLYLYETTAYVSAFAGKPTYLEDEVNLEITGYEWRERRLDLENYLVEKNEEFLARRGITYLYFVRALNSYFKFSGGLERIFTNQEVDIYRVN